MSVSDFHGGLEWLQPLPNQQQSLLEESKDEVSGKKFKTRDINEFFNPRKSSLSLEERLELCTSVGEEIV